MVEWRRTEPRTLEEKRRERTFFGSAVIEEEEEDSRRRSPWRRTRPPSSRTTTSSRRSWESEYPCIRGVPVIISRFGKVSINAYGVYL